MSKFDPEPEAAGLPELDARLQNWTRQWSAQPGAELAQDQALVNQRLRQALCRFFGRNTVERLETGSPLMPLAGPLFAAFLGKRAARELTRRVLTGL